MYPVSVEFNQKMRAVIRRIYAKVIIDYLSTDIDQNVTITLEEI